MWWEIIYELLFIVNFLLFPVVKEFWKSVENWRSYRHGLVAPFFWVQVLHGVWIMNVFHFVLLFLHLPGKVYVHFILVKMAQKLFNLVKIRSRIFERTATPVNYHVSIKPGFHCPSWRPELTARVDGWPVSITRQHGPCWRAPGFH